MTKDEAYRAGQRDGSEGKKDRAPYGTMNRLTSSRKEEDRMEEVNRAYMEGHRHGRKQRK